LLNRDGKSIKPSLSGKCTNHFDKGQFAKQEIISHNFIAFPQSWSHAPISYPEIGYGYQQTYYRLCSMTFSKSPPSFQSISCLLSLYGINQRLSDSEINSSQNLLHYEEPVFKASTLYREKVISDIIKQLRRQEYDFSGLIQEIYRPSHPF